MKLILSFFLVISVLTAFSQKTTIRAAPSIVNDTIYIGIANKIALANFSALQAVKSVDATARLEKDVLILIPRRLGKHFVSLQFKDSIVKRSYIAVYLPDPSKSR
jgi:hypothetical protein